MISINLPKKASLYDIVNRINSLKESSVGIDASGGIEEVSSSESYDMVLPYNFYRGSAVVYNNEIHILGSYGSSYRTKHYKWDGSSWTKVSTLPYDFRYGSAVVYNNEIHILGGSGGNTKRYKWNGSSWTSVSTLPYSFYRGSAILYNNDIHILGSDDSSYYTAHYKYGLASLTKMYLPSNTYIICDPSTSVTSTPSNLTQFTYGYIVNNTGIVTISGNFTLCYIGVTKVL